ncbi:MAG TPA: hypothetical protein VHN37_01395 [Actinomycetota bacterium]|nr:hypothetical protein [Actinomycetota bacterium]
MGWKPAVAAAVLVMLVSCEPAREAAAPVESPEPGEPSVALERVELDVLGDFAVAPALPDTTVDATGSPSMDVGNGSVVILALERPPTPARCLAEVRLRLFLEEWSELAAEELAVYPSHVFDALRKSDGDRFGYSGSLLDVRPRATLDSSATGWSDWDVTAIVKLWTGGGAFPSRGLFVPERGPIVLALRDVDLAPPFANARIASTESGHAPHAVALVKKECPDEGRA